MGGVQAVALDHTVDSDVENPFHGTSRCHMMRGSPVKTQPDPMWQTTKWLEAHVGSLGEEDIMWWLLVMLLTHGGPGPPGNLLNTSWPCRAGQPRCLLVLYVHLVPQC